MLRIVRYLRGELEGDVDLEGYGFDVVRQDPPDDAEAAARVGALYAQMKERTGVIIPKLEPYLECTD